MAQPLFDLLAPGWSARVLLTITTFYFLFFWDLKDLGKILNCMIWVWPMHTKMSKCSFEIMATFDLSSLQSPPHLCGKRQKLACFWGETEQFLRISSRLCTVPSREAQVTSLCPPLNAGEKSQGCRHIWQASHHWWVSPALLQLYRDVYTEFCFSPTGTNSWRVVILRRINRIKSVYPQSA